MATMTFSNLYFFTPHSDFISDEGNYWLLRYSVRCHTPSQINYHYSRLGKLSSGRPGSPRRDGSDVTRVSCSVLFCSALSCDWTLTSQVAGSRRRRITFPEEIDATLESGQ